MTEAEGNNRHRDQSIKTEGGPASQDPKRKNLNTNNDRHFIHFKDAVGRKFTFPWEYCRTWAVSIFTCRYISPRRRTH